MRTLEDCVIHEINYAKKRTRANLKSGKENDDAIACDFLHSTGKLVRGCGHNTAANESASGRESITETEVHCNAHPALAISIRSHPMRAPRIVMARAKRKSNGCLAD